MADDQAVTSLAQLNKIFALAEQMQAVNTDGVAPLSHPLAAHMDNIALRLREDVATETNRRDAYQAVAPKVQDGLYLVPKSDRISILHALAEYACLPPNKIK